MQWCNDFSIVLFLHESLNVCYICIASFSITYYPHEVSHSPCCPNIHPWIRWVQTTGKMLENSLTNCVIPSIFPMNFREHDLHLQDVWFHQSCGVVGISSCIYIYIHSIYSKIIDSCEKSLMRIMPKFGILLQMYIDSETQIEGSQP